jgi:hypothetical protein
LNVSPFNVPAPTSVNHGCVVSGVNQMNHVQQLAHARKMLLQSSPVQYQLTNNSIDDDFAMDVDPIQVSRVQYVDDNSLVAQFLAGVGSGIGFNARMFLCSYHLHRSDSNRYWNAPILSTLGANLVFLGEVGEREGSYDYNQLEL